MQPEVDFIKEMQESRDEQRDSPASTEPQCSSRLGVVSVCYLLHLVALRQFSAQ